VLGFPNLCESQPISPDHGAEGRRPGYKPADRARPPPRVGTTKNWTWITLNSSRPVDEWKPLFARMRQAGIRAILPAIYDGRHACFASQQACRLEPAVAILGFTKDVETCLQDPFGNMWYLSTHILDVSL
jgi:hypothetical protein